MEKFAPFDVEVAEKVYMILVEGGAENLSEDGYDREDFVYHQSNGFVSEYRFMGNLGFGGKFRRNSADVWYVDCYSENITPEIESIIKKTNDLLAAYQATVK